MLSRLGGFDRAPVVVAVPGLFARLSVLAVVAAAAESLGSGREFNLVVYLLAVSSALQTLMDPGVASCLLARSVNRNPGEWWGEWRAGVRAQVLASTVAFLGTIGVAVAVSPTATALLIAASLAFLSGAEGTSRCARVSWQARHSFGAYAAVDTAIGVGRLFTALAMVVGGVVNFTAVNVAVGVALSGVIFLAARPAKMQTSGRPAPCSVIRLLREAWPYGLSTSFSAVYAQGPGVLLGLVGTLHSAAVYSVATRITQPSELLPNGIAAVYLPRLLVAPAHERRRLFRRQAALAIVAGAAVAVTIAAVSPLLLRIFGMTLGRAEAVVLILAAVLPAKFLSYQLVSMAIAQGRIRSRLVASAAIAGLSLVLVIVVASRGAVAVALVSAFCELTLLTVLLLITHEEEVGRTVAEVRASNVA